MPTSNNPPGGQPAKPAGRKSRFTVQELKAIHDALLANPATKNLVERVMDVLNDPGVSLAP